MDYKKVKTETTAITRRIRDFDGPTGNIYETVAIVSKRANQIAVEMKEELNQKLQEFATTQDNLAISICSLFSKISSKLSVYEANSSSFLFNSSFISSISAMYILYQK